MPTPPAPQPFAAPPMAPPSQPQYSSPSSYTEPAPSGSAADTGPDASTQAVDVQALFDRSGDPAPQRAYEPPPTATATQPRPMESTGNEVVEAEVLDDDAFFATLREAVHDETPLGPRDEDTTGEHSFFDAEDDRAGFRDVFRRRR
jgi:hypothetical protein